MLYIENLCEFVRLMVENEEQGLFWPQNSECVNTSELVQFIAAAHGKKMHLVKGFAWSLKLLSHVTGLVNKAFGNLCYASELSVYNQDYCMCNFKKSVMKTEIDIWTNTF